MGILEPSSSVRDAFFDAAACASALLSDDAIATGWDGPSALAEFSLRGLAGHLVRGVTSVEGYLDRPAPDAIPISAAQYYARAVDDTDISSALHTAVRRRGEEQAAGGHARLVDELADAIERVRVRIASEPAARPMLVFRDLVVGLDEYLRTRVIELVVHIDDLAQSVGREVQIPAGSSAIAIETLIDVARVRHGDLAVLRALTRRERDSVRALRVL